MRFKVPYVETELSIALRVVVPTAQTPFLSNNALFTVWHAFSSITYFSDSFYAERSSTSTGRNVPKPTCNVISAMPTPLSPIA